MRGATSWDINLLIELIKKDLKLRYSRPVLGFFWSFISPLCVVAILYLVFQVFLKVSIAESPFVLYLMSAVFSWKIFQDSLMGAVTSIVDNRNLIKESKFPQYIIPVSVVLSNFINNLPPIMLLFVFSQAILRKIPVFAFMLPLVIVNQVIFTASLAVIFSLLYVKYRDIKYIVELLLMLFFYLTPVFYSLSLVEGILNSNLYLAYICNPLVGILSQYRSVFINGYLEFILLHAGFLSLIIIPVASTVVCLLVCICLFRKVKDEINDYLSY